MKKIFLIFPLIFFTCFLNSSTHAEKLTKEEKLNYTILLPINYLGKARITLVVNIPKNYTSLKDNVLSDQMEFIPEGDDEYKWSQIITLQVSAGAAVPASAFL